MATHYEILGVEPEATLSEISTAYRFLVQKFHPDVNRGQEEESRRRFLPVQSAFEILSNVETRLKYDYCLYQASLPVPPQVIYVEQPEQRPLAPLSKKITPTANQTFKRKSQKRRGSSIKKYVDLMGSAIIAILFIAFVSYGVYYFVYEMGVDDKPSQKSIVSAGHIRHALGPGQPSD